MTTLGSLIDRSRTFTRDNDGRFVDDDDFVVWANEAVDDLGSRLQLFDHEFTDVTTGSLISIPPSASPVLIDIMSLNLDDDTDVDFTLGNADFRAAVLQGLTLDHTIGHVFGDTIECYPVPEVGTTYVLRYKKLPVQMESTDDIVPTPRWLDRKLVAYMTAMAFIKEKESGADFFSIYEQGLPTVSTGREKFFTPPVAITRRPNTFDMQPGARHV